MLYTHILQKYQQLDTQIQTLKLQLNSFPPGKLICCKHKKHTKWYRSDGHNKSYIPKADRLLAEQLAQKKYLSLLVNDLEHEKRALQFYISHHSSNEKSERFLTQPSEYQKLLAPFYSPESQELSDWMDATYERNLSHPENLIYKTLSGSMVRSKSELMIDMCLRMHKIPFRYECALNLNETIIYPDFTLKHPITHQTIYWEHFGMMDNPTYANNASSKIRLYIANNIIPSINLITTYETKDCPLSTETIEKIIDFYF